MFGSVQNVEQSWRRPGESRGPGRKPELFAVMNNSRLWLAWGIPILLFFYLFFSNFLKWGNLGENTGYEILCFLKVGQGAFPLKDFTSMYAPLFSFIYGIPLKIWPSVYMLIILNLLVVLGCSYFIFAILKELNNPYVQVLAICYWILAAVFQPTGSYFFIQGFAGTFGQFVLLGLLKQALDYERTGRPSDLMMVHLYLILSWGTKYEQMLASYLFMGIMLVLFFIWKAASRKEVIKWLGIHAVLLTAAGAYSIYQVGASQLLNETVFMILNRVHKHLRVNDTVGFSKAYVLFLIYWAALEFDTPARKWTKLCAFGLFGVIAWLLIKSDTNQIFYFSKIFLKVVVIHAFLTSLVTRVPDRRAFTIHLISFITLVRTFREGFYFGATVMALWIISTCFYMRRFESKSRFIFLSQVYAMMLFCFLHYQLLQVTFFTTVMPTKWGPLCLRDTPIMRTKEKFCRLASKAKALYYMPSSESYLLAGALPFVHNFQPSSLSWAGQLKSRDPLIIENVQEENEVIKDFEVHKPEYVIVDRNFLIDPSFFDNVLADAVFGVHFGLLIQKMIDRDYLVQASENGVILYRRK